MAYAFTLADVAFVSSERGESALQAAAGFALTGETLLADLTRLREIAGEHAAAVAETVVVRRRAVERWGGSAHDDLSGWAVDRWLMTETALQQASPPPVARYRAGRLADAARAHGDAGVHDVTCSIGTDVVALAGAGLLVVGSDIDPVRLAMARHNLRVAGAAPARAARRLVRSDARHVVTRGLLRYADPARRDETGRRITSADTVPSVEALDAADPGRPAVLRLPPGIDYERLGRGGEIEIVSWQGSVKEAVAWPDWCATAERRATVLRRDGTRETLTDRDPANAEISAPERYLVEPDPAVIRAHLVQQYAARYGLTRLDAPLAYLTGPVPPAGVRCFEILDSAPYSERTLRGWVRRDGIGTLEIKQRGTPVIPDRLRRRIKPSGDRRIARTVVIAPIGTRAHAFWCRALPPANPDGGIA